jgi:CRP-like cAMP-binding protein
VKLTDRLLLSQCLAQNPLFKSLSEDEAVFLLTVGKRRTVAGGEQLFASGSPGDQLFIVLDGTIQILMPTQDGDVVVERFQRGDMSGEIAVLDDQPRTATGRAALPSTLLAIQRDDRAILRFGLRSCDCMSPMNRALAIWNCISWTISC